MQITFKKKHILFACTPLRLSNSLSDYHLVHQLKQAFATYPHPNNPLPEGEGQGEGDTLLQVTITPSRFIDIYKHVSAMPEGMTAAFSTEIMEYLSPQVDAGIQAGDPDWVQVAVAIQDERQQHRNTFQAHTAANLNFLQTVDI